MTVEPVIDSLAPAATAMRPSGLMEALEDEAVHILREAAASFENPVILFSFTENERSHTAGFFLSQKWCRYDLEIFFNSMIFMI